MATEYEEILFCLHMMYTHLKHKQKTVVMNNSEDADCSMDYSYCVIVKLEFVNLITAASFEKLAMVNFGSEHMVICVIISLVVLSLFPVLQIQS